MKTTTNKILQMIFLVLFTYIYIYVIADYFKRGAININALLFGVIFLLIALVIFKLIKNAQKKISNTMINAIFVIFCMISLGIQIFITVNLNYIPFNDSAFVDIGARNFAQSGNFSNLYDNLEDHNYYFCSFPNNWGILIFLSYIYRIMFLLTGTIPVHTATIINIICLQGSIILMYFTAKLIFKDKVRPLFCGAIAMVMPVFYLYTPIFYTDTLSMPFIMGAVYLFIRATKSKKTSHVIIQTLCSALLVAIGYSIKGSAIVLLVAFIIYSFLRLGFKRAICISFAFISIFSVWTTSFHEIGISLGISTEEILDRRQIPPEHWIMMALKDKGGFNPEDLNWTKQFETYDEKKLANRQEIKRRLSEYGASGLYKHLNKKTVFTWNSGKFYSNNHLRNCPKSSLQYFLMKGKSLRIYSDGVHVAMLTLMMLSFIYGVLHPRIRPISLIRLCVFGIALFLMIWETRSRYLINFLPLMIILTADGMNCLDALTSKAYKLISNKSSKETA